MSRRSIASYAFDGGAYAAALLLGLAFLALLWPIASEGWQHVSWEFLSEEPRRSGRAGGISSILYSTFLIMGLCLAVVIPLSLGSAIFLAELCPRESRIGKSVRFCLDVLAAVPSIVFGLFGNALFCQYMGLGFSILSGGLTLACMVLPLAIRVTETGLRAVPDSYRLNAAALGMRKSTQLWHIILPSAAPALSIALILAMGRALAETAALIFTSGYVDRMPESLSDSGRSLSIHIYDLAMNVAGGDRAAYASSLVLLILLFAINGGAAYLIHRFFDQRMQLT